MTWDERFSFDYDPAWRTAESAYPLSPHMPLASTQVASNTVRRFLENLLPEGRVLDIVSTTHQVSRNNIFGLIRELGRETAGALAFFPDDADPSLQATTRREITREELKERIDTRAQVPFSVWDGRVRMSIAGYQDKLPVCLEEGRIYLVEGQFASTHLLKPEPEEARLSMLVANEHFCMRLSQRLGLAAAPVSILRLPDPVLVVERFDRVREPGRIRRVHIIDGCQALDLPVSYKYERNFGSRRDVKHIRDGVSFARLFSISDYTAQKAVARLALTRWALLQFLIGNADAHGKNVSFFSRPDGLAIAPFYDLVSVVQYPGVDHELAMAYGDEFRLDDVSAFAWADFAQRTGTPRSLLAREMRRMGKAAMSAASAQAADAVYEGDEKPFVGRINTFVHGQAQRLLDLAAPMLAVDASAL